MYHLMKYSAFVFGITYHAILHLVAYSLNYPKNKQSVKEYLHVLQFMYARQNCEVGLAK